MASYALRIVPGTTLRKRITWMTPTGPVDLTGMSVWAELRDQSSGLVLSLNPSNGGIFLDSPAGVIEMYASASDTAGLSGFGTWNLYVLDTLGDTRSLVCGRAEYFGCAGPAQNESVIVNQVDTITVLSGERGPPGPGISQISLIANGAIGGHRVVIADDAGKAAYADNRIFTHYGRVIGITTGAAADGDTINIMNSGEIIEDSWSWVPGILWVGIDGLMTQLPPVSGWVQQIATVISSTRVILDIKQPIILV